MTQPVIIAFLVTFVAGPSLCALLLRLPSRFWSLGMLAIGVAASSLAALRLQATGGAASLSLLLLWLAWVLGVTMTALALRARVLNYRARRWLTVLALLATTLPWFGLATARLMV